MARRLSRCVAGVRRLALIFACAALTIWAFEAPARACLTNINCSGVTPVCGLNLTCRACVSDLECGAPLSGEICSTSGSLKGACVGGGAVSDASILGCSVDADCGVGLVCDTSANGGSACVVGCHAVVGGGDTCPIGERCNVEGLTIGVCLESTGAGAGTSTGACSTDTDCVPGLVCGPEPDGGSACVVGCRQSGAGSTCPSGTVCSVADGGIGVCLGTSGPDSGASVTCSTDTSCAAGLVCDGALDGGADGGGGGGGGGECVVGCHAEVGGPDTCQISAHCSVFGGGLGICLRNGASGTSTTSCNLDSDCVDGLVCDHSLDGGASCIFGCHATGAGADTCPIGAHCSDVGGGVGVCLENGRDGGLSGGIGATDGGQDGSTDGATSSSGGGGGGDGSSSTEADSGSDGSGGGGSGGDSGGSSGLDSGTSDGAGGSSDATVASEDGGGDATTGGSSGDTGPGSDATSNPGTVEGAGCSCSTAPGAGSTAPDLLSGGLAFVTLGLVVRSKTRRKKPAGSAR